MERVEKWDDVTQVSTQGDKIIDPHTGEVYLIRKIVHAFHPHIQVKPKRNDILTKEYIKWLENRLWADALELVPPFKGFQNPRVVIQKKGFTIFVTCKPKKGNIIPYEHLQQVEKPLHERLVEKDNG